MKSKKLWLSLLMLVSVLITSCSEKSANSQEEPVRFVKSAEVISYTGDIESIYNGEVKERSQVTLSFKVGGPVTKLLVDVGDYVEKGQVLVQIDKRDYSVQVNAAEAQYKQAKAEYERYQKLYERKKLPENTLDRLKAGYLMAKSQYDAALNALADTDLKAPFSGYVNQKLIENFETVGPGQPIVELLDLKDLEVVFNVPENHIASINKDVLIRCDIKTANRLNLPSKIKTISKKSGEDRLFEVKVILEGEVNNTIKPGMVAKVKVVQKGDIEEGLMVPVESVFSEGGKNSVWVVNKNNKKVTKRNVQVKKICGEGYLHIISDIKAGDVVVTAGVHSLIENQEVKLLPKKSKTNNGGLL